jgi:hypothetical protein
VELIIKPGFGHGWLNVQPDMERIAEWFDEHLRKQPATTRATQTIPQ